MSYLYEKLKALKNEKKNGILTIITKFKDKIVITLSNGDIVSAIWERSDNKVIPLWFYIQTNCEIADDKEFRELDKITKDENIDATVLLSIMGQLPIDKRRKYITGKLESIIFNLFEYKIEDLPGVTFSESDNLYPKADLFISLNIDEIWNKYSKKKEELEYELKVFSEPGSVIKVKSFPEEELTREEKFICGWIGVKKNVEDILSLPIPNRLTICKVLSNLLNKKYIEIEKSKAVTVSKKAEFNPVKTLFFLIALSIIGIIIPVLTEIINKISNNLDETTLNTENKGKIAEISYSILENGYSNVSLEFEEYEFIIDKDKKINYFYLKEE